jgi:excisionase family DNA binding protein
MIELLNAEQVAERLGVSKHTVLGMVKTKTIPVLRISHKVLRFDWDDVVRELKREYGSERKVEEKALGGR